MSELRIEKFDENRWIIPPIEGMRVPGMIYGNERTMKTVERDQSVKQVANVAYLPGIKGYSLAMPDMHWGYGFPIGGVAAFDAVEGVISPGGVGYDINCGVRLVATKLHIRDIADKVADLVGALFHNIPSGVGSSGELRLSLSEEKKVLQEGAKWTVGRGLGTPQDLEATEDGGCMRGADPDCVSERALERGRCQLGTLGSGNHFLEIEKVDKIYDPEVAMAFGLEAEQIVVMIHSGSRGLGYQICDDYLASMVKGIGRLDFVLPDRQLACAYIESPEGKDYLSAMACAANYAWANRQILMHWTGETLQRVLKCSSRDLGMRLVYDLCHNIAKMEDLPFEGVSRRLCVHRKGATRAYPPGHADLPERYRSVGQPVMIPGDMGTGSYVLVGTERAFSESFGSTCHGAGRIMSRTMAKKASKGRSVARDMAQRGVVVMAAGKGTLHEEMPEAYKNIDDVVQVVHASGLSRKVARLKSIGCVKG